MDTKIKKIIKKIKKDGFAVIENLISKRECERLKLILEKDYKIYHKRYIYADNAKNTVADKSFEKMVLNLHNKNLIWFKLFEHKTILKILNVILKDGSYNNSEPYYLNNIAARCPIKGNMGQPIHVDSGLPGVNYNIITNVIWCLDDFNKKNGSTLLVPKSHKVKKYANNKRKIKNKKLINAKQGSALIFNGNLWHGGSEKNNNDTRWSLVLGYARWFIKPSFDFMLNTPAKIYKKLTNKQKSLLGFDLIPPKDEFTRMTRRSKFFEKPYKYNLR